MGLNDPKYISTNSDGIILILPYPESGAIEVENHIEEVTHAVVEQHGNFPIAVKGANGLWDIIEHDAGRYLHYREVGLRTAAAIRPYLY